MLFPARESPQGPIKSRPKWLKFREVSPKVGCSSLRASASSQHLPALTFSETAAPANVLAYVMREGFWLRLPCQLCMPSCHRASPAPSPTLLHKKKKKKQATEFSELSWPLCWTIFSNFASCVSPFFLFYPLLVWFRHIVPLPGKGYWKGQSGAFFLISDRAPLMSLSFLL